MIGRKQIQVTRFEPGRYEGPVYIRGQSSSFAVLGSVQPVTGQEVKALPEGKRPDASYSIRTGAEILNGDILNIFGQPHEVVRVQPWQNGLINHYVATCIMVPFNNGAYTTGGMRLTTSDGGSFVIEDNENG